MARAGLPEPQAAHPSVGLILNPAPAFDNGGRGPAGSISALEFACRPGESGFKTSALPKRSLGSDTDLPPAKKLKPSPAGCEDLKPACQAA